MQESLKKIETIKMYQNLSLNFKLQNYRTWALNG